jgi:hypothetical protein
MCERLQVGDQTVIVCGVKQTTPRFCRCGRVAIALCDWKVRDRKSGTCDAPMCTDHAKKVGRGKHLCLDHERAYELWQRRQREQEQPSLFPVTEPS